MLEVSGRAMEISRELLLHSDRGAAAADISGHSEQILHSYHLHLLVARHLCQSLEIHFHIAWNHAHEMPCLVPMQHKRLEHHRDILPQTVSHMLSRKIVLVELIWNQLICNPGPVQQPRSIRLLYLFRHIMLLSLNISWHF